GVNSDTLAHQTHNSHPTSPSSQCESSTWIFFFFFLILNRLKHRAVFLLPRDFQTPPLQLFVKLSPNSTIFTFLLLALSQNPW
ncbi:hypothetical protein GIB67_037362, partial [Kingdonia uniflora]